MKLIACPAPTLVLPTRTRRGALAGLLRETAARLRDGWRWMLLDADTRWLWEAEDLADLERRLRALERGW